MINLIKAEIYKNIHRPFLYVFTLIISAIILIVEILLSSENTTRMIVLSVVCPVGINFALMLIWLFSFGFSEEYKHGSLKNLVTSNISREKIYLGKVVVQIIVILLMGVIILGVFGGGFLLLQPGDGYSNDLLINELIKIISMLPIFLAGLSLYNLLIILTKRESIASCIYLGIFFLFSEFINLLSKTVWSKLAILNDYLFQTQTSIMKNLLATNSEIIQAVLVGIITFIVFTALGALIFRRTEVK